ncbi:SRPBCC family protein [Streptomyces sp. NPDC089799]|uniref:SRPBCC family protein n=1 Tax=Streptomyces sp. NPDC089799 TaxID=3155066 RepID=UPI00344034DC
MDIPETDTPSTRHITAHIDRPAADVYAFASDPANLPQWAHGLGTTIEQVDGRWIADSALPGRVVVAFAPPNEFGVLDHEVTLPTGETVHNPMRVLPDATGCEVVFTLRRRQGTSGEDFRRDAEAVRTDLATLKRLMEDR